MLVDMQEQSRQKCRACSTHPTVATPTGMPALIQPPPVIKTCRAIVSHGAEPRNREAPSTQKLGIHGMHSCILGVLVHAASVGS